MKLTRWADIINKSCGTLSAALVKPVVFRVDVSMYHDFGNIVTFAHQVYSRTESLGVYFYAFQGEIFNWGICIGGRFYRFYAGYRKRYGVA